MTRAKRASASEGRAGSGGESTRFVLYDFAGREKAFYVVDRISPRAEGGATKKPKKMVAHHIVIVDRSGSMYSAIEPLKDMLIKLLTVDEYHNDQMKVTLLSYSSKGDCTLHFERIPVADVMAHRSDYQKEIKKIRVTGLTCISQAMHKAAELLKDDELTAISLHSDGYANDPSSRFESTEMDKLCQKLRGKNVFVNTIAYTNWSDFKFLSKIANSVSGACVKADRIQEVYDALYGTNQKLSELAGPVYEEALGDYDYQVFLSKSAGRVFGGSTDLRICGVDESDDKVIFKYRHVDRETFYRMEERISQTDEAVFALAKALLAEGQLNTAKFALLSTFDQTLVKRHLKAMTNDDIAAFSQDLSRVLFSPAVLKEHQIGSEVEVNRKLSVLDVISILSDYRQGFQVDLEHLSANYVRRGLRRVVGTRDENGNLQKPWLKTELVEKDRFVSASSFDINRNTATINMLLSRKVRLVRVDDGTPIEEVAGIKLDSLRTFNNYTLVGDGELNVQRLRLKIKDQTLFDLLEGNDLLYNDEGEPVVDFEEGGVYTLELSDLPLVPFTSRFDGVDGVFEVLAGIKTMSSILSAHLKEESDVYTAEQVEALKNHYLSKNLYLNFPTTTEYTDLQEALANGTVDTRVSYKIDLGSTKILNLSKLHSANKFLERMYEAYDVASGAALKDKPKFEMCLDGKVWFRPKKLSARTKITEIDNFQKPFFEEFLASDFSEKTQWGKLLREAGAQALIDAGAKKAKGEKVEKPEWVAALSDAARKLDRLADRIYREKVAPLVFYIGATGLLPDEFDTPAQTAEAIEARYPDLKIGKAEQDGTFFQLGENLLLTIYATNEYFSRDVTATQAQAA